ncbi:extracellular solute-binding protein, partial [Lachnoclostridium sp.]|uniref:ABC transporter substrate-binding protein n=1 Tax=Lachnoclostridium sp. TaxID=2028282 RepID=UPI0028A23812
MKKGMKKFLVALLTVSILTGCGSNATKDTSKKVDNTQTEDTAAPTEIAKKGSITLMASQNWIKDVDRELFKAFEEETGIEVKILLTPDNGYLTLLGTTLSGGSNAVDIFMYPAGYEMISAGLPEVALDLTGEAWIDNYEDWAKEVNSYEGKVIGFSTWGVDYEGILYNKTLFNEKGWKIPGSWVEFMNLCNTIKAEGITPLYEGINGVWHTQSWVYGLTPAISAEKADYIEYLNTGKENKFADITSFKTGLEQIKSLFADTTNYTNDGQAEDWFGSYPALQNREVAMMFTYSAYAAELKANGSTDEWGMFSVPLLDNKIGVSNGGGIAKYINKNSDYIEASKELLSFLAKDENLEKYYSARTDLVTSSFKNVESVNATTATTEMLKNTAAIPEVMFIKNVLY